ncbi:MAG: DEAD/DEAH box helicase family protein, partial [Infirmifilum sp.]
MPSDKPWIDLAAEASKAIEQGSRLVAIFAPTSYGKTVASPYILKELERRGLASRLIHVVPTRALLREVFKEKFARAAGELGYSAAYQSMDSLPDALKSPYFLADIVVTTL